MRPGDGGASTARGRGLHLHLLLACLLVDLPCGAEARPAWWPFDGGQDSGTVCPPPGFDTVAGLNLTEYVRAPWFVFSQLPSSYQPQSRLYCVTARYLLLDERTVSVRNYANEGIVNGPASGTSGAANSSFALKAHIPDPAQPAKLLVGPAFLPPVKPLYGQYWVVAIGGGDGASATDAPAGLLAPGNKWATAPEGYTWAVVTGGPPASQGAAGTCYNGCEWYRGCLGSLVSNGEGFWLLTRDPLPPPSTVAAAEEAARQLRLDTSKLVRVQHAGCLYEGA